MKKPLLKERVGRVALAVGSATVAITLSVMLYDSNVELQESERQLGKAQIRIVQLETNYASLEQKFLSVESESQKLSKRQEELMSVIDKLSYENNSLKEKLKQPTGYENWSKMTVEATGYSLIDDELGGGNITATGTRPRVGVIAVDPKVIPLGSTVYIPAFGREYRAEDTGGLIKGAKIDIYMSHGDEARQWGRQSIEIYVNP